MVGASPRHDYSLFHLFHLPNSGAIQAVYCPWSRQGCPADAQVRETGDNINPFRIFVVGEVLPTGTLEHSHGQALNISAAGLTFLQKEVLLDALETFRDFTPTQGMALLERNNMVPEGGRNGNGGVMVDQVRRFLQKQRSLPSQDLLGCTIGFLVEFNSKHHYRVFVNTQSLEDHTLISLGQHIGVLPCGKQDLQQLVSTRKLLFQAVLQRQYFKTPDGTSILFFQHDFTYKLNSQSIANFNLGCPDMMLKFCLLAWGFSTSERRVPTHQKTHLPPMS